MHISAFVTHLHRSFLMTLATLAALAACQQPDCDCLIPASALVFGHVSIQSGAPVAGATLLGYAKSPNGPCDQAPDPSGLTETAPSGQYRLALAQAAAVESACVFVQVRPPQGSGLRDTLIGPLRLSLRYTSPLDSVKLDVTLLP